ncbi:hypothetical protein RIF29_00320 [Crotalaria pallida]|uniref:Legume lectin domain-containing protein n=1 Tax=Crotalaria pallida TaxID=3830 RepID=A0AAN9P757_CROPI
MANNGSLTGNSLGLLTVQLGYGNASKHVLAIEFDDFRNEEFNEVNDNHVGVEHQYELNLSFGRSKLFLFMRILIFSLYSFVTGYVLYTNSALSHCLWVFWK